jgi:hypothetical protein
MTGQNMSGYICGVFRPSWPRNAQKGVKQIKKKSVWDFSVDFLQKLFDCLFWQKAIWWCFFPFFSAETPRNAINKNHGKLTWQLLSIVDSFVKRFRHGLFARIYYGVFELCLPKNTRKRTEINKNKIGSW